MANCFRCGKELSQPKCDRCGFDPRNGVRLLTRWNGKYDIPKVEPKAAAPTSNAGGTQTRTVPPTSASQTAPTPSSAGQRSQSAGTNQTQQSQANADRMARLRRQIDIEDRIKTVLLVVAILAALAGLIFGGYHLVRWMGTFEWSTWKLVIGGAAGLAIAGTMIWTIFLNQYWIFELEHYLSIGVTIVNFLLMIIFPDAYRPIGALIAAGLGIGMVLLCYDLIDWMEPGKGVVCALFMIANLLLFPHLWGVSALGYVIFVVALLICGGFAAIYVHNDWENPFVLQSVFIGIAAVFYLVGFLAMPHFMHALNGMPEFSDDREVGQKRIEADCSCGETIEMNAFAEDLIHGTHCVFKFVFIPECEGDETGHWQICVCGETYNYQEHTYNDEGICGFCKYPQDGTEIGGETDETSGTTDGIESTEKIESSTMGETDETSAGEETSGEENSTEENSTEEDSTQGGLVEDPSNRPADTTKTMSIRTVVIIGAAVAALLLAGAVVYYLRASRGGAMRRLSVRGTERLVNFTVTGVYGVIVLTVAACAFLKAGVFGLSVVQLIIGLVLAVVLVAVMIGTEQATDEYAVQTTVSIILSVLNAAAMLIFPDGYRAIGAMVAGGLAVSFAHLTFAGFDDYETGWGGASAIFMGIDLLLVFMLFGISGLGWIVLAAVVLLWIVIAVIYSCHTEMVSGLQIGFGVVFLVGSLCGYLFAPHFMHSLHRLPELGEQQFASETEVAAECLCGETVGVSVTTVDWVHSFHLWKEGASVEYGSSSAFHWKKCVCGAEYTIKAHEFNENGLCEDCGISDENADAQVDVYRVYYEDTEDVYVIQGFRGDAVRLEIPGLFNAKTMVIGERAFADSMLLEEVMISEGVPSVGAYAFAGCAVLTTVDLGSVEAIGEGAFMNCESLTEIWIPDTVTEIQRQTFMSCSNLSQVWFAEGVKGIGEEAFSGCTSLVDVSLPHSLTEIGSEAFCRCGFRHVEITYGVTSIGGYAFSDNANLESVGIPTSVTQIGEGVFSECPSLTQIFYHGSRAQWDALDWPEKEQYEPIVTFAEEN